MDIISVTITGERNEMDLFHLHALFLPKLTWGTLYQHIDIRRPEMSGLVSRGYSNVTGYDNLIFIAYLKLHIYQQEIYFSCQRFILLKDFAINA